MGSSFLAASARRWMSGLSVAMEAWQRMHLAGCGMASVVPLPRGSWQSLQDIFAVWTCSLWLKAMGCAGAAAEDVPGADPEVGGLGAGEAGVPASCAWMATVKPNSMASISMNFCTRNLFP